MLFTYRTALHESTGYSPYRVNFGQSPNLPVDVMLGRVPLSGEGEEKGIPEFVEDVKRSLKGVYNDVRWKLNEAHQKNKSKYDEKVAGSNLTVGDRLWLHVPAVKQGRTRKLSSLWRGPYTVIDRVGAVTYWIQLIGSPKTLVVNRNRLKLCYGEPQVKASNKQIHLPHEREEVKQLSLTQLLHQPSQRQSQHMRNSLQINKKLDHLEDIRPHQLNYKLRQEDHNVIADPQCVTKIILLIDFVTFLLIL